MINKICTHFFIVFLILSIFIPYYVFATSHTVSSTVTISAQVNSSTPSTPAPSGGGGGGGGGGGFANTPTSVNFSGIGYPLSKVTILQDGKVVATTISDPGAKFSVSVGNLTTDNYMFVVYGEDSKNQKSISFSFPIFVTSGTTVNIGNIFLPPTLDIDKSEVKHGENLMIFGVSAPESDVTISVHSPEERFYKVKSNKAGLYLYNLDTAILELGKHETKSKSTLDQSLSSFGSPIAFNVGSKSTIKEEKKPTNSKGDLSGDNRINLKDFSVMAFWFKKLNPPAKVDLNGDGKISLIDFSIMAYNWTG